MRRLTSGAEALVARPAVHLLQAVFPVGRAVAVLHAVVAREVRARLGGRHEVVDGNRVLRVRQLDVDERRARAAQRLERVVERATHVRHRRPR